MRYVAVRKEKRPRDKGKIALYKKVSPISIMRWWGHSKIPSCYEVCRGVRKRKMPEVSNKILI